MGGRSQESKRKESKDTSEHGEYLRARDVLCRRMREEKTEAWGYWAQFCQAFIPRRSSATGSRVCSRTQGRIEKISRVPCISTGRRAGRWDYDNVHEKIYGVIQPVMQARRTMNNCFCDSSDVG